MAGYLSSSFDVHCLDLKPNNGAEPLDFLACQIGDYANEYFAGQKFDLVGYSMGGLVARWYVQRLGGMQFVRKLITIGSPHNGTITAFLLPLRGVRQMRPSSAFLKDLNSDCAGLEEVGFTSIWTPFDLTILPARSSVLPIGRSIRIGVAAHPLLIRSRRVMKLVAGILADGR